MIEAMKPVNETDAKIRHRLLRECEGVVAEREIQEELARHHLRYLDSKRRSREHWKRIMYILRLFGPDCVAKIVKSDQTGILREIADNPPQSDDGSIRLPLWKAMREYLREEGQSRVGEIQLYLESKGYTNSYLAKRLNPQSRGIAETFGVRTRKHERLVSLKESEESESSSDDV